MTNHLQNPPLPPTVGMPALASSALPPAAPIASPSPILSLRKNRFNGRQMLFGVAALALVSQVVLPPEFTPAGFAGEVITIIYTRANERLARIENLREQIGDNRKRYTELLSEAQAWQAKCQFAIVLDPKLPEQCAALFDLNYRPQLRLLESEIIRLENELKTLDPAF